jgi:hypothetical protein
MRDCGGPGRRGWNEPARQTVRERATQQKRIVCIILDGRALAGPGVARLAYNDRARESTGFDFSQVYEPNRRFEWTETLETFEQTPSSVESNAGGETLPAATCRPLGTHY